MSTILNDITSILINAQTPYLPKEVAEPILRIRQQINARPDDSQVELALKLGKWMVSEVDKGRQRYETTKNNWYAVEKLLDKCTDEERREIFNEPS